MVIYHFKIWYWYLDTSFEQDYFMNTGTYVVHPVRACNELRTDCLRAYLDDKNIR